MVEPGHPGCMLVVVGRGGHTDVIRACRDHGERVGGFDELTYASGPAPRGRYLATTAGFRELVGGDVEVRAWPALDGGRGFEMSTELPTAVVIRTQDHPPCATPRAHIVAWDGTRR